MNSINVIAPYKYLGMWVFDDPRVGLAQEPFVGGADTMIDRVVAHIPNADKGFTMAFSAEAFPGHAFHLAWRRGEGTGNVYYSAELDAEGWLCPALLGSAALFRLGADRTVYSDEAAKPRQLAFALAMSVALQHGPADFG